MGAVYECAQQQCCTWYSAVGYDTARAPVSYPVALKSHRTWYLVQQSSGNGKVCNLRYHVLLPDSAVPRPHVLLFVTRTLSVRKSKVRT